MPLITAGLGFPAPPPAGAGALSWARNRRPAARAARLHPGELSSPLLSVGPGGKYSCENTRMYEEEKMDAFCRGSVQRLLSRNKPRAAL